VLVLCRADDPCDPPIFQAPGRLRRLNKPVSTKVLLQAVREALHKAP
jgi:hypothetical protein